MSDPIFVTAGGLRIDYLITRDGKAHTRLPGGNALYAAAGAAFWTKGVALWARYGQNFPPHWLTELEQHGLHTQGLLPVPGDHEHRTFYAYTADGQRNDTNPAAHFARINQPLPVDLRGYIHSTPGQDDPYAYEPLAPRPQDWPAAFTAVTSVHLSPLPLATHLHVPKALRQRGVKQISLDPGERYMTRDRLSYIQQILTTIDVFLPSDQEVRSLFDDSIDLGAAARAFCAWGARLVVIKMGAAGVMVLEQGQQDPIILPPYHRQQDDRVIDVTGAGDAFCGGFMVGLARAGDAIHAAQLGLVSASLVIEGYGALYALQVDKSQALRRLETITAAN
jgi:ribokinase